jgi:hypothetical protein
MRSDPCPNRAWFMQTSHPDKHHGNGVYRISSYGSERSVTHTELLWFLAKVLAEVLTRQTREG